MTDLDQGGRGFQRARTYLGPTLGWKDELVSPSTEITVGGTHVVQSGESLFLINVAAVVTIQLPDVRLWFGQNFDRPSTAFERSITIKDIGGNANNFNIAVTPYGQQAIDGIQQSIVISQARANVKLIPLVDLSGWMVETAIGAGGGSGGGDVFKAGNNTFTGTNHFQGTVTVPTQPAADSTLNAASTAYVKSQNYITGVSLLPYALIESPAFTGFPTAPTPAPSADNNTVVTVGFVENALAAFSGGAPTNAEFVIGVANAALPLGRVPTNSATVGWDLTIPGQIKANTISGGGNVSNSGTPAVNQLAQWVTSTTIKGVDIATLGYQPLDADLTALSALTGTNTIYYRSAPDIWSPVTYSGLTFSGGVLTVVAAGGDVFKVATPALGQTAQWTDATHIKGVQVHTASTTAPVGPTPGNFWYDQTSGTLSVYVDDGNSQQWVQIFPSGNSSPTLVSPQGRLTLQTVTPVMTTTQSAKGTVFYTPYNGNLISCYNGTSWVTQAFAELSNVLANSSVGNAGPAAAVLNSNYDLFVWFNAGVPTLTRGPVWTNATTRALAINRLNGIWVNSGAITNGPATSQGVYVGTIRTDPGAATVSWTYGTIAAGGGAAQLGVWNCYNRVDVATSVGDSTASWVYNSATIRAANNNVNNRISFVLGIAEDSFSASYSCAALAGADFAVGVGLDSTTAMSGVSAYSSGVGNNISAIGNLSANAGGFHFLQACESVPSPSAGSTFLGAVGALPRQGLIANLRM